MLLHAFFVCYTQEGFMDTMQAFIKLFEIVLRSMIKYDLKLLLLTIKMNDAIPNKNHN